LHGRLSAAFSGDSNEPSHIPPMHSWYRLGFWSSGRIVKVPDFDLKI
jgi:hypothetical protein